jgi:deazaflavin-dependent oxidoreductase (nitroreductase family)
VSAGHSAPGRSADFNRKIVEEFRANGGRVSGALAGTTLILLHHIGARTGVERVTPLACSAEDGDRLVIVASNGGSPTHPDWYYNLKAHPSVEVELGTEAFTALAEELDDPARDRIWPELVGEVPTLGLYQAMTTRRIPVLMLTRRP